MKKIIELVKTRKNLAIAILCWVVVVIMTGVVVVSAATNRYDTVPVMETEAVAETEPTVVETTEPEIILIEEPVLYSEVVYVEPINEAEVDTRIHEIDLYIRRLYDECIKGAYTEEAISAMTNEITRLEEIQSSLNSDLDRFARWKEEHYYATTVWMYLRENGCSKAAAAGIIGNMMAETSGGSMNLNPTIYSKGRGFYGLCQWSLYYRPEAADMSFDEQLVYLVEDMPKEFDTFAHIYKRGFTYETFLNMDNPRDAAHAFAEIYERCGSGSYGLRKQYAEIAYEYFTATE